MRVMGLARVADTKVGNALVRGVSGGERKRVTSAEMLVGPKVRACAAAFPPRHLTSPALHEAGGHVSAPVLGEEKRLTEDGVSPGGLPCSLPRFSSGPHHLSAVTMSFCRAGMQLDKKCRQKQGCFSALHVPLGSDATGGV